MLLKPLQCYFVIAIDCIPISVFFVYRAHSRPYTIAFCNLYVEEIFDFYLNVAFSFLLFTDVNSCIRQ